MRLPDRFEDVRRLVDVEAAATETLEVAAPRRLTVRPRLVRVRRGAPPSLWVVREGAVEVADGLVDAMPREVLARLAFAWCDPVLVLRARPLGPPPELEIAGSEAYAAVPGLPGRRASARLPASQAVTRAPGGAGPSPRGDPSARASRPGRRTG